MARRRNALPQCEIVEETSHHRETERTKSRPTQFRITTRRTRRLACRRWRDRHHRTRKMTERTLARPRALVIGGSVGGLFAAHLLRDVGWDVAVFERAAGDLGDRGTGIGTREELFAVMRRIGLATDASIGIGVEGRVGLDRDGRVIHELPVRAVTSAWSRIWRPLRQALPDDCYAGGKTLVGIEQNDDERQRGVRRWLTRRRRSPGRRRRAALHGSRAVPSRARAALCRLRGLARRGRSGRAVARTWRPDVAPDGVRLSGRRADAVDPDAGAARRRQTRLPFRLVPAGRGRRPRRPLHRCERHTRMASRSRRR